MFFQRGFDKLPRHSGSTRWRVKSNQLVQKVARFTGVLSFGAACFFAVGCGGSAASLKGRVIVAQKDYSRGQTVRADIEVPKGTVGTELQIQRKVADGWQDVAVFNPRINCPEKKKRPEGGYVFITRRGPLCRYVNSSWVVNWDGMTLTQCRTTVPADPGEYRVCVYLYTGECILRDGPFGFEIPKGKRKLVCSDPFKVSP